MKRRIVRRVLDPRQLAEPPRDARAQDDKAEPHRDATVGAVREEIEGKGTGAMKNTQIQMGQCARRYLIVFAWRTRPTSASSRSCAQVGRDPRSCTRFQ